MIALDFYKKKSKLSVMKTPRSTVGRNMNLSLRVEKPKRGAGAYSRKNKFDNKWE